MPFMAPSPNVEIDIALKTKRFPISLSWVKSLTVSILKELKLKDVTLSLVLVDDRQIQKMNRQYLKHDYPTDVIAFGFEDKMSRGSRKLLLGDVVISLEMADRRAEEFEHTFRDEFGYYLCHGILHLIGYKDKSSADADRMHLKQKTILKKIGFKAYGHS